MPLHSNLSRRRRYFSCSICNEFVELETAKIDESGKPIHEECYVKETSFRRSIRPPPKTSDTDHGESSLSQAVITFLNAAEAQALTIFCPVCGSQLEHRNFTFFFEGQTRTARLSICLDCHPIIDDRPHA
jgi:hypothetical protein